MKKIKILVSLALVLSLLSGICCLSVTASSPNAYDFSSFSEEDSMRFIQENNIVIPYKLSKSENLASFTRELIIRSSSSDTFPFCFNYEETQQYAMDIYYAVKECFSASLSSNEIHSRWIPIDELLLYNKVKNSSGQWVDHDGYFDNRWSRFNCYAYSIHREEYPPFYSTNNPYRPGDMSNMGSFASCDTIDQLAELIREDLWIMEYDNVSLSPYMMEIDETQELICVRMNDRDYHFMRYDPETDAWYHKPGGSAILKYNGVPSQNEVWHHEWFDENGVGKTDMVYDSTIIFIRYSKNSINLEETSRKYIAPNKDVLCEINIDVQGEYTLQMNSQYSVEYELYDANYNVVLSGNDFEVCSGFSAIPGKYYLRMNFEVYNSNYHYVDIQIIQQHTHSYTHRYVYKNALHHYCYCSCDAEPITARHATTQGTNVCLLCGASLGLGGGTLNSIPTDYPHTENGSYILPNGIIVLVPEDEEAYLNGTLEFRTGEIM